MTQVPPQFPDSQQPPHAGQRRFESPNAAGNTGGWPPNQPHVGAQRPQQWPNLGAPQINAAPPALQQKRKIAVGQILIAGAIGVALGVGTTLGISALAGNGSSGSSAAGSFAADSASNSGTALRDAVEACDVDEGFVVGDGGKSLTIDNKGDEDYSGASIQDIVCVLNDIDVPDYVVSNMSQITSMDGRQSDSWDSFTFQYSYHPDRGLDGVITTN